MIMFEPISSIEARILRFDPCPMASIAMTAATPMITPNMVRKARILLLAMARNAIRNRFL